MPYKYKGRDVYFRNECSIEGYSCTVQDNQSVQDFDTIRQQCLKSGKLFEDPNFPAHISSIGPIVSLPNNIEWRRPKEIHNDAQFFVDGISRFDINQGKLGDCWLLAPMAALASNENMFNQVVPEDQGFEPERYAGIFHFIFWEYGRYVDIVIDDRLPYCNGKLLFLNSTETTEYWSALLEKAYAKFYGSYECLISGLMSEAMVDFTGGVCEFYHIPSDNLTGLFDTLMKGFQNNAVLACAAILRTYIADNDLSDGLPSKHAYSITQARQIKLETSEKSGVLDLIRIRNPWGNKVEWNGLFSDKSPEWKYVSDDDKRAMELTFKDDGEFWMIYIEFLKKFTVIELCHPFPELQIGKIWYVSSKNGSWLDGKTAGGCEMYPSYQCNPKYYLRINNVPHEEPGKSLVLVTLLYKHFRCSDVERTVRARIGISVYKFDNNNNKILSSNLVDRTNHLPFRDVTLRLELLPGEYCVVPSTYVPGHEASYMLRVFSIKKHDISDFE